jgi:hypothetical protein
MHLPVCFPVTCCNVRINVDGTVVPGMVVRRVTGTCVVTVAEGDTVLVTFSEVRGVSVPTSLAPLPAVIVTSAE